MAKLPDNVSISIQPGHEISNCHWDEEYQLYRVTVDGEEYVSAQPPERLKGFAQSNRRRAAAFEAMADCAAAREKADDEDLSRIRSEVMAEAGYFRVTEQGYRNLGANDPTARRLVDLAVEARLKLEREGRA